MRDVLALPLLILLASCGSAPTTFHSLSVTRPEAGHPVSTPACAARPILVERVQIPAMLDREALVSETGPGRIDVSDEHRWAGPLDGMMQRVLAEDLRARLAPGSVLAPGDPAPAAGARGLQVNVQRFMPGRDRVVSLDADWSLLDAHGHALLTRSESLQEPAGSDADGQVTAMSRALAVFSDRIAASLPPCSDQRRSAP